MKAIIDLEKKGMLLRGQNLILSTPTTSICENPLACCMPISTSTSSFLPASDKSSFLPFTNILWIEETNSGKPNEFQVAFAHPIIETSLHLESTPELPYKEGKKKIFSSSERMTIELDDSVSLAKDEKITDLVLRLAYPFSKSTPFKPQSILVLINPHSGKGEALSIYNKEVKPILEAANCKLAVKLTEYSGHAMDIVQTVDIEKYDTILCASGDGIPYEVLNGFYKRVDRARAFSKINIVQTPGGSGNAMSLSCLGATSASLAALRILKGKCSQCDLMAVTGESSDEPVISFLSQTYGAIAQADIGTECMRLIGGVRFDLGVAYEVFTGKKYPGDLAIKWKCQNNGQIVKHYMQNTNDDIPNTPSIYKDSVSISSKTNNDIEEGHLRELNENDFKLKYHSNFKQSCSFDSLPSDWEVYDKNVTDNMRIFYAGKMPYIAATTNFFPAALPSDGAIDLVVFDGRSDFLTTTNALLSLEKGTHVWEDGVEHFKVEAFRLIPKAGKKCFLSVDGERFPYEAFQVEVMNGILRTILWEGQFAETGFLHKCSK